MYSICEQWTISLSRACKNVQGLRGSRHNIKAEQQINEVVVVVNVNVWRATRLAAEKHFMYKKGGPDVLSQMGRYRCVEVPLILVSCAKGINSRAQEY